MSNPIVLKLPENRKFITESSASRSDDEIDQLPLTLKKADLYRIKTWISDHAVNSTTSMDELKFYQLLTDILGLHTLETENPTNILVSNITPQSDTNAKNDPTNEQLVSQILRLEKQLRQQAMNSQKEIEELTFRLAIVSAGKAVAEQRSPRSSINPSLSLDGHKISKEVEDVSLLKQRIVLVNSLRKEIKDIIADKDHTIEELRLQVQSLQVEVAELSEEGALAEERVEELRMEILNMAVDKTRCQLEIQSLSSPSNNEQQIHPDPEEINIAVHNFKEKVSLVNSLRKEIKGILEDKENTIDILAEQVRQLQTNIKKLTKEKLESDDELELLRNELADAVETRDAAEVDISILSTSPRIALVTVLKKRIKELTDENVRLREKASEVYFK